MKPNVAMLLAALAVVVSACGNGSPGGSTGSSAPVSTPSPAPSALPVAHLLSPYIDVVATPVFSMTAMANATGHRRYTLAFFQDGGGCTPEWGGVIPLQENHYADQIDALRASGGDVILSFGGAAGVDLALACATSSALEAAYQQVVTQYQAAWLDFDVEGGAILDSPSIDRRNQAIEALEARNPGVRVSYTLPAGPSGLDGSGLLVLQSALKTGARVDVVNIMAMDYGGAGIEMGTAAISAAEATKTQLSGLGMSSTVGVTVMIGQNDSAGEVFTLADAQSLVSWAESSGTVTLVSYWSANRDNGGCAGQTIAFDSCSGVDEGDYGFASVLKAF